MTTDSRAVALLFALVLASSCLANQILAAPQTPPQGLTEAGASVAVKSVSGALLDPEKSEAGVDVIAVAKPAEAQKEEQEISNNENDEPLKDVALEPKKSSEVSKNFDIKKLFDVQEWVKLIFNPLELVKRICEYFRLPMGRTLDKLGGVSMVRGLEPLLYPLVFSTKIVERLFQPDQCRLKFACSIGRHLNFVREHVLQFSPNFLEGSTHLKALSEGIVGRDCSSIFPECEPKLRKPFEELKDSKDTKEVKEVKDSKPASLFQLPLGLGQLGQQLGQQLGPLGPRGLSVEPAGVEQKAVTILDESKH